MTKQSAPKKDNTSTKVETPKAVEAPPAPVTPAPTPTKPDPDKEIVDKPQEGNVDLSTLPIQPKSLYLAPATDPVKYRKEYKNGTVRVDR